MTKWLRKINGFADKLNLSLLDEIGCDQLIPIYYASEDTEVGIRLLKVSLKGKEYFYLEMVKILTDIGCALITTETGQAHLASGFIQTRDQKVITSWPINYNIGRVSGARIYSDNKNTLLQIVISAQNGQEIYYFDKTTELLEPKYSEAFN